MAETKSINVSTMKPAGNIKLIFRHCMLWGFLVGAEAAAHLLFGGSWVIDIIVLTVVALFVVSQVSKSAGFSVEMTKAELRLWVAAGMPDDIKQWRADQKLAKAA